MSHDHLVSVGIPAYNRPEGLRRTLECLTAQTYKNLEIIISNDCAPNPEVEAVALEFMGKDPRIQYFWQKANKGGLFNFRFVVEKATGKYFMWAADDDEWDPRFVEVCVNKLNNDPRYGLVFTKYKITSPFDKKRVYLNHNHYLKTKYKKMFFLLLDESFTHKANMSYGVWRREIAERVMQRALFCGLTQDHMGHGFDNAFLLVTLGITEVYQIQEALFTKRYMESLIPGSCRTILMDTFGNLIHAVRHPVLHIRNSIVRSGQYMEVIERVYNEDDSISKSLIFFVKRIEHIIRVYIF